MYLYSNDHSQQKKDNTHLFIHLIILLLDCCCHWMRCMCVKEKQLWMEILYKPNVGFFFVIEYIANCQMSELYMKSGSRHAVKCCWIVEWDHSFPAIILDQSTAYASTEMIIPNDYIFQICCMSPLTTQLLLLHYLIKPVHTLVRASSKNTILAYTSIWGGAMSYYEIQGSSYIWSQSITVIYIQHRAIE